MKKITLTLIAILLSLPLFSQNRERININNDWQFTPGYEVRNNVATQINLPHTWNVDAMNGKADYYRGLGNYSKKIFAPEEWQKRNVYIRFGAANHTATVFVNGKCVGEHRGGYTAFAFDISKKLKYNAENTIEVRVSNALDLGVMPLVGDFNFYGGIYRDVEIILLPENHISIKNFASNGIRIIQKNVSEKRADFAVKVSVEGGGKVNVDIKNSEGKIIDSKQKSVAKQDEIQTIEIPFSISNPQLWNGRQNPYMYTAEVSFENDKITEHFGLRFFEINEKNEFVLNGKVLQIHGVGRHQDFGGMGNAIHREQMKTDVAIMLEMGVNAVRLTHYPHDPYFISLCDSAGIIVWSEIPFVGPGGYRDKGFVNTKRFRENGKQQLAEMIEQLFNHPSILMWGLFNELKESGDNPVEYVKELNAQAKSDDASRLTVAASNQDGAELNTITDLIGFNKYYGWYGGTPETIGEWGAKMRREHPQQKVAISEYGAGASILHQQDSLKKPIPTAMWHPENWQTHYHEIHWKNINEGKYFWGTFIWAMFDFYAAHRTEGDRHGVNDKGLVTIDRAVKKDAFYFYKANWDSSEKFVYIAERRNTQRKSTVQTFKIFSNTDSVELLVNGKKIGTRNNNGYGTFVWENCNLQQGKNTIEAIGNNNKCHDTIEINVNNEIAH